MGMGLGCWVIVILLAVYVVLGFLLAWIAAMVAKEEIEVKTGVITLMCSGLVSLLARVGVSMVLEEPLASIASIAVDLGVLTLMINLIAKLNWKHSVIIAAIYTVLMTVVMFGIRGCGSGG
jgi:hypothetical protein